MIVKDLSVSFDPGAKLKEGFDLSKFKTTMRTKAGEAVGCLFNFRQPEAGRFVFDFVSLSYGGNVLAEKLKLGDYRMDVRWLPTELRFTVVADLKGKEARRGG